MSSMNCKEVVVGDLSEWRGMRPRSREGKSKKKKQEEHIERVFKKLMRESTECSLKRTQTTAIAKNKEENGPG